jgi:hypothetical protein
MLSHQAKKLDYLTNKDKLFVYYNMVFPRAFIRYYECVITNQLGILPSNKPSISKRT